ncbi:MAG: hypothetical protein KAS71_10335 [Bacteroidales bacterium]|nr:hypothetical protein [Bacteroidales bacterium]
MICFTKKNSLFKYAVLFLFIGLVWFPSKYSSLAAQERQTIAILYFDTNDNPYDSKTLGNMMRIEVEKTQLYSIIDKYDMFDLLSQKELDIENCFGRNCLVEAGKILGVDKMLTGSVEKFGGKIVFTIRLIDVNLGIIEKSVVMEYIDEDMLISRMAKVSLNELFDIENDQVIVDQLTDIEEPLISTTKSMKLNGPRMGIAYLTGDLGEIIMRKENKGGYDGYPVISQFGYQYEIQYLSAGDFQALVEFIGMLSGLEQKIFIPSVVVMNGFRLNDSGWEIAFGPSFKASKIGVGFYDTDGIMGGAVGEWYLDYEWYELNSEGLHPYMNRLVERMDSRGDVSMGTGWVWALGKTFKSGYLNIPVNIYVSPNKNGWYAGLSVGFNTSMVR